jgi:Rieske Fe-S protein
MTDAQPISRRRLIATASVTACALPLAACAGTSSDTAKPSDSAPGSNPPKSSGAAKGHALADVSDIPVGSSVSGKTADGKPVLISQPKAGTIVAFSAICTHMGCTVAPAGKELHCPCHGSTYDAATGKVLHGPAPRPLPPIAVKVTGKEVVQKDA